MDDALAVLVTATAKVTDRARTMYAVPDRVLTDSVRVIQTLIDALCATQAAAVHEINGRGLVRGSGAANASTWLREHARVSIHRAHQITALGSILQHRTDLADALHAGALTTEQALVVGRVIDSLPTETGPAITDEVVTAMIGHARIHEPAVLAKLGDRVLAHVAPDLADAVLRKRIENEERQAQRDRTLTLTPTGDGRTRLRGILDTESAAILTAALSPLMTPVARPAPRAYRREAGNDKLRGSNQANAGSGSDLRTPAARRADALVELCHLSLRTGDLPLDGGQPPQINITINYRDLAGSIGHGTLDTGEKLSAGAIRRMACDAKILPVVLNGASVPIDVGRSRRLYSGAARFAIVLRDRGCVFPACDRPPRWCQIHHAISWLDGGPTDQKNGVLLCGFHHRVVHQGHWTVIMDPEDHKPWFIPPADIDATQTPQRNAYHQRT